MSEHGFSTRAIHGRPGPPPATPGVPLVYPIVAATTYAFETAAEFGRVMAEEEYGFLYSRLRNPTLEELNATLADLEGAEAAYAFGSGMSAIAAALLTNLRPGDTLLAPHQLYGTTYSFVERRLRPLGIEIEYADVTDLAQWNRPARVRYAETLANPGMPAADLRAIAETKGDGLFVVDNTFASPVLCRPLELGADIVCESATKYLNGHHDVSAGVVAGSQELVRAAHEYQVDAGGMLDPFSAFLLRRGLKTLVLRVERASANAAQLAEMLESHPAVERVHYARFGGVFAFVLVGGRSAAEAFMDALELAYRATSLGGVDTVVSHPASTSHRQYTPEQLARAGISPGLLRVSVGCEDGDDLVADVRAALERV
jgi:methionine-gamma-lyase